MSGKTGSLFRINLIGRKNDKIKNSFISFLAANNLRFIAAESFFSKRNIGNRPRQL
jgi:hypothetical protein